MSRAPATLLIPLCLALSLGGGGCTQVREALNLHTWSCGVPHCRLYRAPGLRIISEGDARRLVHDATGVHVDIDHFDTRAAPERLDALLAARRAELGLVVNWSQPPQHAPGFVVRGLTGTAPPPPGVLIDPDPHKVWFATYLNSNTGSVLTLQMSAPASVWDQAWAAYEPVLTRVVFSSAF